MDDDECSFLGGKVPITIKASGGSSVTVNYTVNTYLLDWQGIRQKLKIPLPGGSETLTAAAVFMAAL